MTSSITLAEEKYIMTIGVKGNPNIINNEDGNAPPIATFKYIEQFNMSSPEANGSGSYSNNNKTVRMNNSNSYSKSTFPVEKSPTVNEVRIRFQNDSYNFASGVMLRKQSGSRFLYWYSNTDIFYVYNDSGQVIKQFYAGGNISGSSIKEIRYNMDTNEYQFLINDVIKAGGVAGVPNQNYVDARIYEGSSCCISTTYILAQP